MALLRGKAPRAAGPEIDNVIEHEAGLRSVREAGRMLGLDEADVLALIGRCGLPNAYRTSESQWRIPLEDIQRCRRRQRETGHHGSLPAAVLIRWRYPHNDPPAEAGRWMTPNERRHYIMNELQVKRSLRVSTLSARLGVSQMTIRRDLARLETEGRLTRSYGGAMANQSGGLVPFESRDRANGEKGD
jgi:hypothetical protein